MTTGYMSVEEHILAARILLEESEREHQAQGASLQLSEKLWGEASHASIAKAKQNGWTVGSHRALVNASQLIADEQDDEWFRAAFSVAQKFHNRFYGNSHFDPFTKTSTFEDAPDMVARYVNRVLAVVEGTDLRMAPLGPQNDREKPEILTRKRYNPCHDACQ